MISTPRTRSSTQRGTLSPLVGETLRLTTKRPYPAIGKQRHAIFIKVGIPYFLKRLVGNPGECNRMEPRKDSPYLTPGIFEAPVVEGGRNHHPSRYLPSA